MWFKSMWGRQQRIVRFLITGCTAAVVGFGTLILFADIVKLWYLYASMLAYVAALLVNFTLQKQWVFSDKGTGGLGYKMSLFLGNALLNFLLNIALMYIFVDLIGLWHLFAQGLVFGMLASMNYVIYQKVIFTVR